MAQYAGLPKRLGVLRHYYVYWYYHQTCFRKICTFGVKIHPDLNGFEGWMDKN
jgi:hypothetical protein